MKSISYEFAKEILKTMPNDKKETLKKALNRNMILTSARILENGKITVYKEGWYLELNGCRCRFAVWAEDNDGELIIKRKPNENKLHRLYKDSIYLQEYDYEECVD